MSGQTSRTEHQVSDVFYDTHVKRNAPPDAPRTMRVEYRLGFNQYISEWVCFEHTGYARTKAESWWRTRSNDPVPDNVDDAVNLAEAGSLAPTLAITVERKAGEKYDRVVAYQLGEKPVRVPSAEDLPDRGYADDEVPF